MAVICHADSGGLLRYTADSPATSNMPPYNSYTMAGWFYRTGANAAGLETALCLRCHDGVDPWNYILNVELDTGVYYTQVYPAGAPARWTTHADDGSVSGKWWYLAITGDGSNTKGYWYSWNGSTATLVDSTVQSTGPSYYTSTGLGILCPPTGDQTRWWNGKCCYVRVWDAVLSQSEIEAELVSSVIVKTANINTALGACTDSSFANDVSGNGRNWTRGAGLSTSDYDSDTPSGLTGGGSSSTITPNTAAMSV